MIATVEDVLFSTSLAVMLVDGTPNDTAPTSNLTAQFSADAGSSFLTLTFFVQQSLQTSKGTLLYCPDLSLA